jgi:hypothetical protein
MSPQCSMIDLAILAHRAATSPASSDCAAARAIAPIPASASTRSPRGPQDLVLSELRVRSCLNSASATARANVSGLCAFILTWRSCVARRSYARRIRDVPQTFGVTKVRDHH